MSGDIHGYSFPKWVVRNVGKSKEAGVTIVSRAQTEAEAKAEGVALWGPEAIIDVVPYGSQR